MNHAEISYQGQRLAFFHPGIGAPLVGGLLEEAIAFGCRKFIACGGCGVLEKGIGVGDLSGADWDNRGWQSRREARASLFWLSAEACLGL